MASGPSAKDILLDEVEKTLGKDALATVEPTEPEAPPASKFTPKRVPICFTQNKTPKNFRGGPANLVVGMNNECPRWVPGSVVRWAAFNSGFPSDEDAKYAAEHLAMAADQWNKADVGVKFEWVPFAKDATFVLVYGDDQGGVLASAFFPNKNDLECVYVYSAAFEEGWKEVMYKVFTHELGHVLGLRHEFAIEKEGAGAVQLGPRNEMSVMNYRWEPPEIQQSDIDSTRAFYALKPDASGKPPRVGMTRVADYIPE